MRYAVGIVVALSAPLFAHADIYRCKAADGTTLYSDAPCPNGAVSKSNITTEVGACSTAECETQRRQESIDARERLRAEKEELAVATERRAREDEQIERKVARVKDDKWRQSVEERLANVADDAVNAGSLAAPLYPAAVYPAYPQYPTVYPRPCGARCGNHHRPYPTNAKPGARREPSVSIKDLPVR